MFKAFPISLSPEIKKITSLEYAPLKKQIQAIKQDVLKTVQRHTFDCASLESASNSMPKN